MGVGANAGDTRNRRGRVTVLGGDIRKPPLFDGSEAQSIVIRDSSDEPMAFFVRILSDDTWGLCTRGDPDWFDMLERYGFARVVRDSAGANARIVV